MIVYLIEQLLVLEAFLYVLSLCVISPKTVFSASMRLAALEKSEPVKLRILFNSFGMSLFSTPNACVYDLIVCSVLK